MKFPKGTVIMTEGSETDAALYMVREGKLKVTSSSGEASHNFTAEKGTYFGEELLSLDNQYAKSAKKSGKEIDRETASEYVQSMPVKTKAVHTVTVEEDTICGVLDLKGCRALFDTTRFGHGRRPEEGRVSHVERSAELDDLIRHVMLGSGTFGQVWLISIKNDADRNNVYALKIQSKSELIQAHQAKGVVQEMNIMKQLNHPGLLRLVKTFSDDDFVYMMLGLVQGGELFNRIHSPIFDGVPEATAKFYAAGVYEGLAYMHRRQMIYRDLKPENVLIDHKGYPVIVDFGFGKLC